MSISNQLPTQSVHPRGSAFPKITVGLSLTAIVATYLLANSAAEVATKTKGFSAIIAAFLVGCALLYFRQHRSTAVSPEEEDLDRQLAALDEAKEYFSGALDASDTFRLVVSRIRAIVPISAACLWLLDPERSGLFLREAVGLGADERKGERLAFGVGLTGECYDTGEIAAGREAFSTADHGSECVAIPLRRENEVFSVLQLFIDESFDMEGADPMTFEAVGSRVAPLILSSIAFEQSQANALTDTTTDLPNERAFYLVLENRLAEATRKRGERPLTILTVDIKGFDDINRRFGHTVGDKILAHVAGVIKENLRQMDFFARALNDEFLAILPTASKEICAEVMERIGEALRKRRPRIGDNDAVEVELNFGWAAFGDDGETADQLVGIARLRKEQAKHSAPRRVLSFSRPFVN